MRLGDLLKRADMPIMAGANDRVVGYADDGQPIRQTRLGDRYWNQPQEAKGWLERQYDEGGIFEPKISDLLPAPTGPVETTREYDGKSAGLGPILQALYNGIKAPGKALMGETVTNRDVTGTALDWGLMTAPATAPAGALRAGAARNASDIRLIGGGKPDVHDLGWTFRDVEYPKFTRDQNRMISFANETENWTDETIPISSLTATQPRVNADFDAYKPGHSEKPLVVKSGGKFYVMDGHHRIMKTAANNGPTADVRMINLDGASEAIGPLLGLMDAPRPTGIRAYHGSPHDFDRFDIGRAGSTTDPGALGRALYFSDDPRVGDSFPHKYEVSIDAKNPLTIEMPDFRTRKVDLISRELGIDPPQNRDEMAAWSQNIADIAKSRGHDSIILDNSPTGYNGREIAVFDDKLIDIVRKYGLAGLTMGGALGMNGITQKDADTLRSYLGT